MGLNPEDVAKIIREHVNPMIRRLNAANSLIERECIFRIGLISALLAAMSPPVEDGSQ